MGQPMIPKQAIIAAREAMREVTPPPGWTKAEWLAEYGKFALIAGAIAAASPYMHTISAADIAAVADMIKAAKANGWDEGRKHGARYPYGERGLGTDDNPYRSK